jgi:hypothetical protein
MTRSGEKISGRIHVTCAVKTVKEDPPWYCGNFGEDEAMAKKKKTKVVAMTLMMLMMINAFKVETIRLLMGEWRGDGEDGIGEERRFWQRWAVGLGLGLGLGLGFAGSMAFRVVQEVVLAKMPNCPQTRTP